MAELGMQFVTIASGELVGLGIGVALSDAVGIDEKDLAAIDSVPRMRDVLTKWNDFAAKHRPLPRLVVFDRGAASEICLGSRA